MHYSNHFFSPYFMKEAFVLKILNFQKYQWRYESVPIDTKNPLEDKMTLQCLQRNLNPILGLTMGRARLVLDLSWTRPTGVGWKAEGPKTDCRCQLVESILASSGVQVSLVDGESCRSLQMSPEFAKKLLESAKTHYICTENCRNLNQNCRNLLEFGRIQLNLTKYDRDIAGSPLI